MRREDALCRRFAGHTPGLMNGRGKYAVLCPFLEKPDGVHLLFEVRAANLRRQPGEICFPGGRMEPGETPEVCALRETEEELSVAPETVELWGRTDFMTSARGGWMQPVAGLIRPEGLEGLRPSPSEVAEIFTVPLEFFRKETPELYHYDLRAEPEAGFPHAEVGYPEGYAFRGGQVLVPIWRWEDRVIWGLTARVIRNLLEILE